MILCPFSSDALSFKWRSNFLVVGGMLVAPGGACMRVQGFENSGTCRGSDVCDSSVNFMRLTVVRAPRHEAQPDNT